MQVAASAMQGAWAANIAGEFVHLLEMQAVLNMLHTFAAPLACKTVRLLCDNPIVIMAIRAGFSKSQQLCELICELHKHLIHYNTTLILQWVASADNRAADALS